MIASNQQQQQQQQTMLNVDDTTRFCDRKKNMKSLKNDPYRLLQLLAIEEGRQNH